MPVPQKRVFLAANTTAPRRARAVVADFLHAHLASVSDAVVADAQLVISELVTNALVHAGLGYGDAIALTLGSDADWVRIDVDDHGRGCFAKPAGERQLPPGTTAGIGLRILDRLCDRWQAGDGRVTAWLAARQEGAHGEPAVAEARPAPAAPSG